MSPYSVDKDLGGDSPANDKYMEKCVMEQKKGGKSESYAVAVCKTILRKHIAKMKRGGDSNSSLEYDPKDLLDLKIDK